MERVLFVAAAAFAPLVVAGGVFLRGWYELRLLEAERRGALRVLRELEQHGGLAEPCRCRIVEVP